MSDIVVPMPYPVDYGEMGDISNKEFGLALIVIVLWCIGFFYVCKFMEDNFDKPMAGAVAYLLATGLTLYYFG